MMVLSEERLLVRNQKTKETTFIKRPLQLIVSLEADQLEIEQQEPAHGQFGSKRPDNCIKQGYQWPMTL